MGSSDAAFDVALGSIVGSAFAGRNLAGRDALCQGKQVRSQALRVIIGPARPMLRRRGDQHALITAFDMQGQVIGGNLQRRRVLPMGLFDTAL